MPGAYQPTGKNPLESPSLAAPALCTPSLWHGATLGEHPTTPSLRAPPGHQQWSDITFLNSQSKMEQGRVDQGWQHGGIKHSPSCPAVTVPESKCSWVPGHPHHPSTSWKIAHLNNRRGRSSVNLPASQGTWYLVSFGSQVSLGSIWTSTALQEQQRWRVRSENQSYATLQSKHAMI